MEANPNDKVPVEPTEPTPNDPNPVDTDKSEDMVKYSSYRKAVSEKKALQSKHADAVARLAEYEAREKEKEEQQLIADKKFDQVLAEREKVIEELSGKLTQSTKTLDDTIKLQHFIANLGSSKIDSKYFGLIPLENIQFEEDGAINSESLSKTIADFKAEHPRLLVEPKTNLPNHHVGDKPSGTLSYEAWRNLKSSKEQEERFGDIDWSTKAD